MLHFIIIYFSRFYCKRWGNIFDELMVGAIVLDAMLR